MNKNAPKMNENDLKTTRFILPILTFGTADPLGASARAVLPRRPPQKRAEFVRAPPVSRAAHPPRGGGRRPTRVSPGGAQGRPIAVEPGRPLSPSVGQFHDQALHEG